MSGLRWWCMFGLTAAAVAACYAWIDRPVSWFVHDHASLKALWIPLTYIPEVLPVTSTFLLLVAGALMLSDGPVAYWQRVAVTFGFSILGTELVETHLKRLFGRTWPETWTQGNPSLIRDNAYGFNFLHAPHGKWYAAFPSGHTAAICAAATVLWVCYPRLRPICAAAVAAVTIGLIGANFHFLGDVVAGAFLGVTISLIALRLAGLSPNKPPRR